MEVLYPRCAGLDVHKDSVFARVRCVSEPRHDEVRNFGTTTTALFELNEWLSTHGVTHVAMEATGVYWKPVWHMLEGGFELVLANDGVDHAAHVGRAAGVVDGRGESIGASAGAHVHADDVESGGQRARGIADDVFGIRRAFEAMDQNDRQPLATNLRRLPMTVAQHLTGTVAGYRIVDFDQQRFGFRQGDFAWQEISGQRLQMAVAHPAPGNEVSNPLRLFAQLRGRGSAHDAAPRTDASTEAAHNAPVGSSSCLK